MTNLGNVVGLLKGIVAPVKKYIFWAKVFNTAFPDETVIYQWSKEDNDWIPFSLAGVYFLPPVADQTNTPPVSPALGDKYIIGAAPTGVWTGKANKHAVWTGNQWTYTTPKNGTVAYKKSAGANHFCFNGTVWTYQTPAVGDYLTKATNVQSIDDTGIADGEIAIFDLTNKKIKTSDTTISTDGTLGSNSDDKLPTEKAINTKLGNYQLNSEKGAANGYAGLDGGGKVPASQLPSYVDDVIEFADYASLPGTGESGKIYVLDTPYTSGGITSAQYRWSGSAYIPIIASPGSTDAVTEGSVNKYFSDTRAYSAILSGWTPGAGIIANGDSIKQVLQKLSGNISSIDSNAVHKTGNESIAGVKTFSDLSVGGILIKGNSANDTYIVNAGVNSIQDNSPTATINGGGRIGFPNIIGIVNGLPTGTGLTPVGWTADSTYPGGGASDVAVIGGGYDNIVNQEAGWIGGGGHNFMKYNANGHSAIGGGSYNVVSAGRSGIFNGYGNSIVGATKLLSFIGQGQENNINGSFSTIPNGYKCSITGDYSFAWGSEAIVNNSGSMLLKDTGTAFTLTKANSMVMVFSGGVGIGRLAAPADDFHIKANETGAGSSLMRLDNSGTVGNEVGFEFWTSPTDIAIANRTGRIYGKWDGGSFSNARLTFQTMSSGNTLVDTLSLKNGAVGIGIQTPTEALHVIGKAIVTGVPTNATDVVNKTYSDGVNISSSAGTLALGGKGTYKFTGTTSTWTLLPLSGNIGVRYTLVNRGSGDITLNSNAGGNDIDESGVFINTIIIATMSSLNLYNDGTKWIILD